VEDQRCNGGESADVVKHLRVVTLCLLAHVGTVHAVTDSISTL